MEAPHPNAPVARSLARAASFTFDYLPPGRRHHWDPCDGRVLLESGPDHEGDKTFLPDLAVCDPVSRRYLLLPPIPGDLIASVQFQERNLQDFDACLLPSGEEEDTSFVVVAIAHCVEKLVVFIFSSGSGRWSVGTTTSWDAISLPPGGNILCWPHFYMYGCFYWKLFFRNKLLKFNMNTMEFCTINLPPDHAKGDIVIVEAGEGTVGMFSQTDDDTSLYYTIIQNGGEMSSELKMEKVIPMPMGYTCCHIGAFEGYIFLSGCPKGASAVEVCFSLEVKTLKIERVGRMMVQLDHVYPYFGFSPSMSPRRI